MEQAAVQAAAQESPKVKAKRDVLIEIASGYTLAATIMSFLSIWGLAVYNLSTQNLL